VRYAAESTGGAGSFLPFLTIILLFVVMYFMLIRPQQKRRREAEEMQASLGPGDQVVTIGGLYGTVTSVDDESVMLEVAPGVQTRYVRAAIARVVTSAAQSEQGTGEASAKE
jgi:preprotein translocase subunit YajC